MQNIDRLITVPLTDRDLNHFGIPNENVIKYSTLANLKDIDEILPHDKSYKVILIEYERNSGHWVCIMRYGKTLEYFNPFGLLPTDEDFMDDDRLNDTLDQEELFLNTLFEKETKENDFDEMVYNKVKFQSEDDDINTCGRHVVHRIVCMLDDNMHLEDYVKYMEDMKKKTGKSYDYIVTDIIS
jgi:hypothetical protein